MEHRQLEAFAAVMSSGSITAAGRLLGRSQPAVTRLIQDLEAQVGYALFVRNGPRVSPTEQGFLLYEEVERALASLRRIQGRADEIARGEGRPLHVAATAALAVGLLPAALASLQHTQDTAHINVHSTSPERVVHAVLTGAAQVGVTSLPLEHRGVQVHWIGQAPCVAVVRDDDPLAACEAIPLAQFHDRALITMANPYRLRPRLDRALAQAGATPTSVLDTNSSLNALAFVRAGLGVSVVEPVTAYGMPLARLVVRPLDTHIPFFFGVITPQSMPLLPAVAALVQALQATAASTLPGFVARAPTEHAHLVQSQYGDDTPTLEHSA